LTYSILLLVLTGCGHSQFIGAQLKDRINLYQSTASKAYTAGKMDEYRYWRGVADGIAVARGIFEE
jgi:hypothetical protein